MATTFVEALSGVFAQKLFACYDCRIDEEDPTAELQVIPLEVSHPAMLFPPAEQLDPIAPHEWGGHRYSGSGDMPPREENLKRQINLPTMPVYPCPPTCTPADPEDQRQSELLRIYQEFVMDMHKGIRMTLLTSQHDYSEVHCWISDDLRTLKLDEGSGCIIEFPLNVVSSVQRLVRKTNDSALPWEHVVIIEFERRKLAFAFNDLLTAQNLLVCLKLLIYQTQSFAPFPMGGLAPQSGKQRQICT
eukprot:TRINITY_DN21938_c0_g1_i1.p1 TRINITY_DN21938_c0_g1~~TRINITY_DN21938_c0_g1_i1.p1  ORF type:complete len:246 (+),score=34.51 TRINITY_DN21938_c0_g1_i1:151-888(+)